MRLEWPRAIARILLGSLLILVPTVAAAEGDPSVWVSTGMSVLYGGAQEIVWAQGNQVSYRESELDWSLKPLVLASTGIGIAGKSGFRGDFQARFAAPLPSGTITDSDYLNFDGVLTHFSQHDAYAERAIFLDLDLGWEFPLRAGFSVTPFVSADLALLKLSARNGYLQYPPQATAPFTPWSTSTPMVSVYGTGILYEQDTLAPAVGLRLSAVLLGSLRGTISCAVTPLVWGQAVDNHLFRQLDFTSSALERVSDRAVRQGRVPGVAEHGSLLGRVVLLHHAPAWRHHPAGDGTRELRLDQLLRRPGGHHRRAVPGLLRSRVLGPDGIPCSRGLPVGRSLAAARRRAWRLYGGSHR